MELIDVLHKISEQSARASQPVELVIGTVETDSPLSITINTAMAPIRRELLYLTDGVVEKKISSLAHSHTQSGGGSTSVALDDAVCTVNGEIISSSGGEVMLNKALQVGDKVLMLRVCRGQKFIVLSRVY